MLLIEIIKISNSILESNRILLTESNKHTKFIESN